MNNKNLVIKCRSTQPLRLVESADSTPEFKKYIFEGVFTACSDDNHTIVNRNGRIYRKEEMLRHLGYLREQIKTNKFILGELDHPDSRFDVRLSEASHGITDIYFNPEDCTVRGKLFVMDTPNGKILRELIDAGFPVYVSSRAAGEVDPKTKEVHIEQIFTYDCVYQPGFEEARLNRVSESMDANTVHYLNESVGAQKIEAESAKKYGVLCEGVSISESKQVAPISEEAMKLKRQPINMKDLCTPLNEGEDCKDCDKKDECDDAKKGKETFELPQPNLNPNAESVDEEDKDNTEDGDKEEKTGSDDEKKDSLTDDEKADKRAKILNIEAVSVDDDSTESDKDEKRAQILDVEGKEESEYSDEDKSDDKEGEVHSQEECDDTSECGDSSECGDGECKDGECKDECGNKEDSIENPNDIKTKEKDATAKKVADKALNDEKEAEDIKNQTKKDMDKVKALLQKAKKLADVKESIVKSYPFAISMSDENFAQFAALQPKAKNMVQKFIMEHNIYDVKSINELWKTPLIEQKRNMKNWLRLASEDDKKLFAAAPMEVQDAIEESAKYVSIQTKEDAELFWSRTGLRQRNAAKILTESMHQNYGIQSKEDVEDVENARELNETAKTLGYSMNYFKMLEDMY